jgi:23S rRNA (uracil1939-C5)-methyltransferase
MNATRQIRIERLGAQGDGVAGEGADAVFVAGALPGETVSVRDDAGRLALVGIDAASPDRIAPVCRHFGTCGGCAVQHLADAPYRAWKRRLVETALARAGLSCELAPLVDGHGAGRRRVTLHGRRRGVEALAGFMKPKSHELIAIEACPILKPELARAPVVAQAITQALRGSDKPLTILITAALGGLDVDVRGHGPAGDTLRLALTSLAERLDLARLSLHGDIVVERRQPLQRMGKALVLPPPGGFLQPTSEGEAALAALAVAATAGARRVADLFAGCGPFALRLAEGAEVLAVESEAKALAALDKAARATPGLRRVLTETRDMFRRPLLPGELKGFDAVVLDPPRAGAEAQCRELANSDVARIAYVSCDPQSFARDAAILTAGGHALERVTPVDQFRYSHHVELVGVFRKARRKT